MVDMLVSIVMKASRDLDLHAKLVNTNAKGAAAGCMGIRIIVDSGA